MTAVVLDEFTANEMLDFPDKWQEASDVEIAMVKDRSGVRGAAPSDKFAWFAAEGYQIIAVRGPGDVVVKGRPIANAIAQWGLLNSNTCYVDNVNGVDTNDGTVSAPFKTLSKALRTSSFGYIKLISTGVPYDVCDYRNTDTGAGALKVVEGLGPVTIGYTGTDISAGTWTMTSGTGSMPVTGSSSSFPVRVLDSSMQEDGMPMPLRQYASLSALDTAGMGWYYDSGATTLHVRYSGADINNIRARLRAVYSTATSRVMVYGAKLALRNVVTEGIYFWVFQLSGTPSYLYMEGGAINYSTNQGIQTEGGHYRIAGTRIHRPKLDGANLKNSGSVTAVTGLEVDCTIDHAGDAASYGDATQAPLSLAAQNVNCSSNDSYPDGSSILIGGRYKCAQGPVVVCAGAAGSPNYMWTVGIKSATSQAARTGVGGANHAILANNGVVWVDSCEASGSDADGDIAAIGTSGVINIDSQSSGTQAAASGSVLASWSR